MKVLQYARYARENQINVREIIENIVNEVNDFEVDEHRFILSTEIDSIMQQELKDDLYMLGCFNADFLSGILDIDMDVITTLQEAEANEGLGKLILSLGKLEEIQQEYASLDGYGHHFNNYDGDKTILDAYHVFKCCA